MARVPKSLLQRISKAAAPESAVLPGGPIIEPVASPRMEAPPVSVSDAVGRSLEQSSPPPAAIPDTPTPDLGRLDEARATSLTKANLAEYDLGETFQLNFDTIATEDDLKGVLAETASRNRELITAERRGVVTHEQLRKLASELDVNEDVVRGVMGRESGGVLNPETILAARQVLNSSADRLLGLAKQIKTGQATDLDRISFRRQFEFHGEYQRKLMGARAEASRSLNAFAIPTGMHKSEIDRLKHAVETMNGHDTDQLAEMLTSIDNVNGVGKITRDYTRSRLMGVTQELFVNSILSGLRTHEINATGSVLFQGMNIAERAVAARIGRFLSGDEHVQVGEASAQLYGMFSGWRDALKVAGKAFRTGEPQLDAAMKFETQTRRAISSRNLLPPDAPVGLARAIDGLGAFIRIPTERVMLPMDEFFKSLARRSEISRLAYLDAMNVAQAGPMTNEAISEHIRKFMNAPPQDALTSATDYSRYVTFQASLGEAGGMLSMALDKIPGARLIAPFIKTPINILKAGLFERSPLALFSARFRESLRKGGPERDLALARLSMGTLTVGTAAAAASAGVITGGGPQDPAARKILEATGWQPYAIRIDMPDGSVMYQSYARAEPLAYVIGATADAVEMLAYSDIEDELKTDSEKFNIAAAAIVAGVANNTMSKTFMSGVTDFTQMLEDPKRYAASWMGNMAQALIPFSSFRRDLARVQDPYIRESWTLNEKIKAGSGMPGFSEGMPPRRDFFAEPVRYKGGSLLGILSPFPDTQGKPDQVVDEIARVMEVTREVPITMPARRVEGMALEVEEYDELVRIARGEEIFSGKTLKGYLSELMDSTVYMNAPEDAQRVMLRRAASQADQVGRALLEERNLAFAERLATWRLKKARRQYGEIPGLE